MTFHVLIIEDQKEQQQTLVDIFETDLGYKVSVAGTYADALRQLRNARTPFDVITIDINLEAADARSTQEIDMSGIEILKYIRTNYREEVCCVITGERFSGDLVDELMAYKFINKLYSKGRNLRNRLITEIPQFLENRLRRNKRIFISYRRADTDAIAQYIHRELINYFGEKNIFIDVRNAQKGKDFRTDIREFISTCQVMLVIIGDQWLQVVDFQNKPRLENADDMLRIEVAEGLKLGIPVIPVLVRGATLPREDQLPPDLRNLVYLTGITVRSGEHLNDDIRQLINVLTTG